MLSASCLEINELLRRLESARFYGSLELKFEAGQIVLLRKTETIKPNEAGRSTRGAEDVGTGK